MRVVLLEESRLVSRPPFPLPPSKLKKKYKIKRQYWWRLRIRAGGNHGIEDGKRPEEACESG